MSIDDSELAVRFGTVLKRRRQSAGLSQTVFAERTGLDRSFVSKLENGHKQPTIGTLARIAVVLQVAMWEIMREVEEPLI